MSRQQPHVPFSLFASYWLDSYQYRCDVALTQRGVVEAVEAGQVFASHGLTFRKCYTSMLTRSIVTAHRALEAAGVAYTPIEYDWRINERHYG